MKRSISILSSSIIIVILLLVIPINSCRQFSLNSPSSVNSTSSVYFSQSGNDPAQVLTGLYQAATVSIDIAIYSMTHPQIISSLLEVKKQGKTIRIITDRDQATGSAHKQALNTLNNAGIPIKINVHQGSMHLKMSIIDKTLVTIGSYNYTQSASKYNDEILSVINDPAIVDRCARQFEQMWNDKNSYAVYK